MVLRQEYTVGIVCPLEVEAAAVKYMLDEEHKCPPDNESARYICGRLSGHNVAIATLPQSCPPGHVTSAILTSSLTATFCSIQHVLSVGIAGGVPGETNDIRLGDVVVGTPDHFHGAVVQWDSGKKLARDFLRCGLPIPTPTPWLHCLSRLGTLFPEEDVPITKYIEQAQSRGNYNQFLRPAPDKDILYQPSHDHEIPGQFCDNSCPDDWLVERPAREDPTTPVIHYGLILSGDTEVKNNIYRDWLAQKEGGAICLDTKAAGVMGAFPCMVIRGICGYCDSHENEAWYPYAAVSAAAMAKKMLGLLDPPAPDLGMFTGTFTAEGGTMTNIQTVTVGGSIYLG